MLVHELSRNVAKGQPSRGGVENRPQDRGRGNSLRRGPNHGLSTCRSHTFSVRIVQCEIGMHTLDEERILVQSPFSRLTLSRRVTGKNARYALRRSGPNLFSER